MTDASNSGPVTPDLARLKRKARILGKARSIPHGQAMELIAKEGGFQNYRHAQNVAQQRAAGRHETVFMVWWWDFKLGIRGAETCSVCLPKPWRDVMTLKDRRSRTRHLSRFEIHGRNALVSRIGYRSQQGARALLVSAVRELTFACLTGLRPVGLDRMAFPQVRIHEDRKRTRPVYIPGQDHTSVWCDPAGVYVIVDEPYSGRLRSTAEERQQWCERYGFQCLEPTWKGIHAPHLDCHFLLYARRDEGGPLLQQLAGVLNRMPATVALHPWTGESVVRTIHRMDPFAKRLAVEGSLTGAIVTP